MRQYWVRNGNSELGPFTREQLEFRIAIGHVGFASEVRETDGVRSSKWFCVADVASLRELVERYAPPHAQQPQPDTDSSLPLVDSSAIKEPVGALPEKPSATVVDLFATVSVCCLVGFLVLVIAAGNDTPSRSSTLQPSATVSPLYLPEPSAATAPTGDDPDEWQRFYQTPEGKKQLQRDLESLERQLGNPKTAAEVERILKGRQ
jgi:hypothetical protein